MDLSKPRTPWVWWFYVILIALIGVGGGMAYDSIAAIAPMLRRDYGVNGEKLAALYAVYHFPNVFWLIPAGIFIDHFGAAKSALLFTLIVFGSSLIFVFSTTFEHMLAARVVLGLGNEALQVTQFAFLSQAFGNAAMQVMEHYAKKSEHLNSPKLRRFCCFAPTQAVAYTITALLGRVGGLVTFQVVPVLHEKFGWNGMWFLVAVTGAGVLGSLVLLVIAYQWLPWACITELPRARPQPPAAPPAQSIEDGVPAPANSDDEASIADDDERNLIERRQVDKPAQALAVKRGCCLSAKTVWHTGKHQFVSCFDKRVWTLGLVLSCVYLLVHSAAIFPFGEISTDFFAMVYDYNDLRAARTTSIITIAVIVLMIPIAVVLDKLYAYNVVLLAGTALAVPALVCFAIAVPVRPEVFAALLGVGSSAIHTAIWPMISMRAHDHVQGRVMATLEAGQSLVLAISPVIVGTLRDHESLNGNSFAPALWYMVALEILALLLAVYVGFVDKWRGPRETHSAHIPDEISAPHAG